MAEASEISPARTVPAAISANFETDPAGAPEDLEALPLRQEPRPAAMGRDDQRGRVIDTA
jgi:hypothetical protein